MGQFLCLTALPVLISTYLGNHETLVKLLMDAADRVTAWWFSKCLGIFVLALKGLGILQKTKYPGGLETVQAVWKPSRRSGNCPGAGR